MSDHEVDTIMQLREVLKDLQRKLDSRSHMLAQILPYIEFKTGNNAQHVIPNDDWIKHVSDVNCECNPKIDPKNQQDIYRGLADKYVFVHNQIKYNKQEMN